MIVPNYLIIPPAIAALIVYMSMYYQLNPVNRITDLRMLLAISCFLLISAHMFVLIQGYDRHLFSMVFCALAFGLLIWSIHMRLKQPFEFVYDKRR